METALKEIRRRYEQDSHINGYCVMDTFNNGYQAALLDVMEILEGYPSILEQKPYMGLVQTCHQSCMVITIECIYITHI